MVTMTLSRRHFARSVLGTFLLPAISRAADRPAHLTGIASGDVNADGAVIWSRTDRAARMWVDVAADERFRTFTRFQGTAALP